MNFAWSPIEWLLESLDPSSRLFHTGQYCGTWKASTQGLSPASFHLIIKGSCWLHFSEDERYELACGDAVFILRDRPHWLSNESLLTSAEAAPAGGIRSLDDKVDDGLGLVCGFFDVGPGIGEWIVQALPDYLILRTQDDGMEQASTIFQLILAEGHGKASAQVLTRLSDLLLIYILRERIQQFSSMGGFLALATSDVFRPLLEQLIKTPGDQWTLDSMAKIVGLSRSAFFKRFVELTGDSPGQVLLILRMHLAAQLLKQDVKVAEVADRVGYQSIAAFTRAFKKFSGNLPGAFRRQR